MNGDSVSDLPGRENMCGIFGWKPRFLQVFNRPATFVLLYSLTVCLFSVTIGMNNFLIPDLQNIFNLSSKQIGMILISNDISGLLLSYTIGHFASKGKIRWIGFGVVLSVVACAMESGTQLFVEGIGNTPLQICGPTYIDEILSEKKLGIAVAVSQILQLLGFSISFIFGASIMKYYVTLGAPPPGVTPASSHWVGAWWLGYFIPGVLLCVVGPPLILFPAQSPAALKVLEKKIEKGQTSLKEKETELKRSFVEQVREGGFILGLV
eukprot:sb/3468302/